MKKLIVIGIIIMAIFVGLGVLAYAWIYQGYNEINSKYP